MSEESASQANQRIAVEIQTKFEFWLVGLIFAVLALAVQTATFTGGEVGQLCELAAWIALLLAGLMGIWRLEWTPPLYHMASRKSRGEAILSEVRKQRLSGFQTIFIDDADEHLDSDAFLGEVKGSVEIQEKRILLHRRRQSLAYRVMRAFLISGFVLLLFARGYDPAVDLIRSPGADAGPEMQQPTSSPQKFQISPT